MAKSKEVTVIDEVVPVSAETEVPVTIPETFEEDNTDYSQFADISAYADGQVIELPVLQIRILPQLNGRAPGYKRDVKALAQSILEIGQEQPVKVRPGQHGEPILIFGFGRVEAIQYLVEQGHEILVKATVDTTTDETAAFQRNLAENIQRKELSPVDYLYVIQTLKEKHGMTQKQIGGVLNRKDAWVSVTARLSKFGELLDKKTADKIYAKLHSGDITITQGWDAIAKDGKAFEKAAMELLEGAAARGIAVDEPVEGENGESAPEEKGRKQLRAKQIKEYFETLQGPGSDARHAAIADVVIKLIDGKIKSVKALTNGLDKAIAAKGKVAENKAA